MKQRNTVAKKNAQNGVQKANNSNKNAQQIGPKKEIAARAARGTQVLNKSIGNAAAAGAAVAGVGAAAAVSKEQLIKVPPPKNVEEIKEEAIEDNVDNNEMQEQINEADDEADVEEFEVEENGGADGVAVECDDEQDVDDDNNAEEEEDEHNDNDVDDNDDDVDDDEEIVAAADQEGVDEDATEDTENENKTTIKVENAAANDKKKPNNKKECTLIVSNMSKNTSTDELKELFEKYGTVENITLRTVNSAIRAYVVFNDENAANDAEKNTHNSVVNGATLSVKPIGAQVLNPQHTVVISRLNETDKANLTAEQLHATFSKCGEIEDVVLLCKKNVLAFLTYKKEESTAKAVNELNGNDIDGVKIEVKNFETKTDLNRKRIFIQNIKLGTTQEEIKEFFEVSGPIKEVKLHGRTADILFETEDGFCKSFLLNETKLNNNIIFVTPFSILKRKIVKSNPNPHHWGGGHKRTFPKNTGGPHKKFRKMHH